MAFSSRVVKGVHDRLCGASEAVWADGTATGTMRVERLGSTILAQVRRTAL